VHWFLAIRIVTIREFGSRLPQKNFNALAYVAWNLKSVLSCLIMYSSIYRGIVPSNTSYRATGPCMCFEHCSSTAIGVLCAS